MNRLLVVRLGSLGDLVHTLPAVSAIRRRPRRRDRLARGRRARDFLALVPISTSSSRCGPHGARLAGRCGADCARASTTSRWISRGCSSRRRWRGCRARGAWSDSIARHSARRRRRRSTPSASPSARAGTSSRRTCGSRRRSARASDSIEFPIATVESAALATIRSRRPGTFALAQSRRRLAEQAVAADRFGRLAAWLRDRHGLRRSCCGGPASSASRMRSSTASGGAACGSARTRLADLVAFSRAATLIVSGDTGPTHIAAAVGTPVVALFGPTDRLATAHGIRPTCLSRAMPRATATTSADAGTTVAWCLGTIGVEEVLGRRSPARVERPSLSQAVSVRLPAFACRSVSPRARSRSISRGRPLVLAIGLVVALAGERVRLWAAGHIEKGREITRSGPYRFVRHPLYLGSAILGVGFAIAAQSVMVAAIVLAYLGVTLVAAMRTEEAVTRREVSPASTPPIVKGARRRPIGPSASRACWRIGSPRTVLGLLAAWGLLYCDC